MNREIKFRAWDNDSYMSNQINLYDMQFGKTQFTKDCIVMQYTGLKDKNGIEIYEGDILYTDSNKAQYVKYKENMAQFVCSFIEGGSTNIQPNWVIIGNIYENPELLK